MKKKFLLSFIGLAFLTLPAFNSSNEKDNFNLDNRDCKYGQCSKIKSDNIRCKNCAQKNSEYCWSHNR